MVHQSTQHNDRRCCCYSFFLDPKLYDIMNNVTEIKMRQLLIIQTLEIILRYVEKWIFNYFRCIRGCNTRQCNATPKRHFIFNSFLRFHQKKKITLFIVCASLSLSLPIYTEHSMMRIEMSMEICKALH